jgi:hypothetical protein
MLSYEFHAAFPFSVPADRVILCHVRKCSAWQCVCQYLFRASLQRKRSNFQGQRAGAKLMGISSSRGRLVPFYRYRRS